MKLFLQILFAVFTGNLASLHVIEQRRAVQTQKAAEVESRKLAEQKRLRDEQGAKIREMLLKGRQQREGAVENGQEAPSHPAE